MRRTLLAFAVLVPLGLTGCADHATSAPSDPGTHAAVTVGDESAIRTLYRSLLDSWPDPDAYAAHFAADVDYIIADGTIEHGRGDIIDCHHTIFGTWARNSTLAGDIDNIRFLTPDVAIITAHGHIVLPDNPRPPRNTVYTLTTHKTDRTWSIVAYQNTPVDG